MKHKRCETCGALAPASEALPGRLIIQPHDAPCGQLCYVGSAGAHRTDRIHGPKDCPKCGKVIGHWTKGSGHA